jgi:diguanylate cyclase (GGDEF)-like protein/PAS domain S-box-containing protein
MAARPGGGWMASRMDELNNWLKRVQRSWLAALGAWRQSAPAPRTPRELTEVLEHSADGVVQTDEAGRLQYLNPTARTWLGMAAEAPLDGLHFSEFLARGAARQFKTSIAPALQARGVWVGETRLRTARRGGARPFSLMALAHRDAEGQLLRFSAVLRDISADVQARQHIQRQHDVLSAITEALPATVVIVDREGRYRFVNSAFEQYVGLRADQILGRTAIDVLGPAEVQRRKPFMQKAMAGEAVDFTLDYPGEQGTSYLALHCIPLKLDGMMDGFVGISQDITAQRREQERLAHLAERDPLTGLLNRAGLALRVERRRHADDSGSLALLYIDLDHFKPVNDQLGHQAGDRLLQRFAHRLTKAVRSSDVVARLGGDEFAILLPGVPDLATASAVADKVLAAASRPFNLDSDSVNVSASIGVAMMQPGDAGLPDLMARADAMLYRAKAAGRGRQVADHDQAAAPDMSQGRQRALAD